MASLLQSFDTCTLHGVSSFLDPHSLGSIEAAAAFDHCCFAESWKTLRMAAEQRLMCRPWWRKQGGRLALPTNHKHALRELAAQLKSLVRVPDSWIDCIRKRSETVIEIKPRLAESVSTVGGVHQGGTEDIAPPAIATVPLSIGGGRWDTFAVGVQLASKCLGCVGEAFLLGAEFMTIRNGQRQVFTVCFSPMSGRVFVRFPAGEGLVAHPLPDLVAAACGSEVELDAVEAFMFVSTSGNLSFGRRQTARGQNGHVEWSGELPQEFLPPLAVEKNASLTFQIDKLMEKAQISITWAGQMLPISAALPTSQHTFDSVWQNHEW
mmetsp:Transcript_109497/g.212022  ORF Transcript_109497/g.212022 Transcript_109497/m.212022 type:complete len:322 (+) Transcript_109497:121-1086(+)